jgi:hypothetical protein
VELLLASLVTLLLLAGVMTLLAGLAARGADLGARGSLTTAARRVADRLGRDLARATPDRVRSDADGAELRIRLRDGSGADREVQAPCRTVSFRLVPPPAPGRAALLVYRLSLGRSPSLDLVRAEAVLPEL